MTLYLLLTYFSCTLCVSMIQTAWSLQWPFHSLFLDKTGIMLRFQHYKWHYILIFWALPLALSQQITSITRPCLDIPSAKFFRLQHLIYIFGEECRFQMPTWSRKAYPWCRTWWERNANFFLHFWRRSTSTGRISSRRRFPQPRNQSKSVRKKIRPSYPHRYLHGALRTTLQTNK